MRAWPEDHDYLSLRYRELRRHLREGHGVDFEVVPNFEVPAAFCPWQRVMWVRPGLPDTPLISWMADVTTSISTESLDTIRYFTQEAPPSVQAITGPHALVVPARSRGRSRGRGQDQRSRHLSVAN